MFADDGCTRRGTLLVFSVSPFQRSYLFIFFLDGRRRNAKRARGVKKPSNANPRSASKKIKKR